MPRRFFSATVLGAVLGLAPGLLASEAAHAQVPAPTSAAAAPLLFAVEITTGPKWDSSKPPQQQPYFAEHSANLKRLRDAGALVLGARYADKGLVVIAAKEEAQARAMLDADPSIGAGVFQYQLSPFHVFYGGTVQTRPRPAAP